MDGKGEEKKKDEGSLRIGELLFGKYRIEKVVGRGGYGRVYKARDMLMDRDIAVKELLLRYADNPLVVRRFIQEARSAGRLQHPNVVTVFNLERNIEDGRFFLIMEYIDGASLRQICKRKPKLSSAHVTKIALAILSGLEHAHSHSIIHRDIKPDNIMITTDERIKIADFGVAKLPVNKGGFAQLSGAGIPAGTAAYLSPEQIRGDELTVASDLYSLGVSLFELLTGEFYFEVEKCKSFYEVGQQILNSHLVRPSSVVSAVSPALDQLIFGLMIKDASDRIQSATEALQLLLEERQVPSLEGRISKKDEELLRFRVPESAMKAADIEVAADLSGVPEGAAREVPPAPEQGGATLAAILPKKIEHLSRLRWSLELGTAIRSVVPFGEALFVAMENGVVLTLCPKTGRELWRALGSGGMNKGGFETEIAVSGKHLALLHGSSIALYDMFDENLLWSSQCSVSGVESNIGKHAPWDPRSFVRRRHLFWYGNLLYLFQLLPQSGGRQSIVLCAVEIADGHVQSMLDTGFTQLASMICAPTDASAQVEGHLWIGSRNELAAIDLLSCKVLRRKQCIPEMEHLALYGRFPRTMRHSSTLGQQVRFGSNDKGQAPKGEEQYYSGFFDTSLLLSLEVLENRDRVLSAIDVNSLQPLWSKSAPGPLDRISRTGQLREVLVSDFSIYVLCDRTRNMLYQFDIHTGELQGKLNFREPIVWMDHGNTGYALMFADGTITEYSYDRNEPLWSYALKSDLTAGMFVFAQEIVLISAEKQLLAFE